LAQGMWAEGMWALEIFSPRVLHARINAANSTPQEPRGLSRRLPFPRCAIWAAWPEMSAPSTGPGPGVANPRALPQRRSTARGDGCRGRRGAALKVSSPFWSWARVVAGIPAEGARKAREATSTALQGRQEGLLLKGRQRSVAGCGGHRPNPGTQPNAAHAGPVRR
jgi:hypothetical protein